MDCEKFPISCQLQRIADSAADWDFDGMWIAIIAAGAGAIVAGLLAVMIFRMEKKERSWTRFVDAVDRLSTSMTQFAIENKTFISGLPKYLALPEKERDKVERPPEPERIPYDLSLDLLVAITRGQSQRIALQVRSLGYEISMLRDPEQVSRELAALRRVLAAWASGRLELDDVEQNLSVLEARRVHLEATPDEPIPRNLPLPQPFEKPEFAPLKNG